MSQELQNLLSGARPAGLYRLTSRAGSASIASQAEQRGWRFFRLDGRQIASKSDFLQACAEALGFPSYFGHNWDALEDSLRDLSWAPSEHGYLLLIDDAGHFAAAAPGDFHVALEIMRTAIDYWRSTPTPMAVLLRGAGRKVRYVPRLK